jgi:DNA-binding NtrC family response regulator
VAVETPAAMEVPTLGVDSLEAFFRRLIDLERHERIEPLLDEVVSLAAVIARASSVCVEWAGTRRQWIAEGARSRSAELHVLLGDSGFVRLEGKSFTAADSEHIRVLARRLASIASRIHASVTTLPQQLRALEERAVADALARTGNNITKAARLLGVTRPYVYAVTKRRRASSQ